MDMVRVRVRRARVRVWVMVMVRVCGTGPVLRGPSCWTESPSPPDPEGYYG